MKLVTLSLCIMLALTSLLSATVHYSVSNLDAIPDPATLGLSASDLSNLDGRTSQVILNGVPTDINTLLPANSGWELLIPLLVKDAGQIAGVGLLTTEYAPAAMTVTGSGTNGSGSSGAQYEPFLLTIAITGDANGDNRVDSADMGIWQQNYDPLGHNQNAFRRGDWNWDGKVDSRDLALWQANYCPLGAPVVLEIPLNEVRPVPAVPEPGSLILLVGSVALVGRRIRRALARG